MLDPKNVVNITGGLVDTPELVNDGKIAKLRVAMDYAGKDSANADNKSGYFDVVSYKNDDSNSKFVFNQINQGNFKKGSQLQIVGRMFQDRWKNEDGKTQSRVYVVAEAITYAGSAAKPDGDAAGPTASAAQVDLPSKF